ncbi:MAG: hypothetical protein E6Q73_06170 [Pseudorhodobacter sp.]|nr:MAG: hypothetical protein E6Q73_06170 [Pseudorhodobacter sp.]
MDRLFPRLILVLAALAMALAGAARAMPLQHRAGVMLVEICGEGGVQRIALDQNGEPVSSQRDCQDCPACLSVPSVALTDAARVAAPVMPYNLLWLAPERFVPAARRYLSPQSRGPPPVGHEATKDGQPDMVALT